MARLEFSVAEIDSLSKKETCIKISDYGGKIHSEIENSKNKTKIIGSGYGGWEFHTFFTDSLYYETLSRKEKRNYNDKKTCKLIRADYSSYVGFEDGSSEREKVFLYFSNDDVFYIKYQRNSLNKDKINETIYHNFFFSDIHTELDDNKFLEEDIINKKNEIMKFWLER